MSQISFNAQQHVDSVTGTAGLIVCRYKHDTRMSSDPAGWRTGLTEMPALVQLTCPSTAQPSTSPQLLDRAQRVLTFWINTGGPCNVSAVRIMELLFLRVHFVQECFDLSFTRGQITRKQNNCSTESRCPTQQHLIVPITLPSVFLLNTSKPNSPASWMLTYLLFFYPPQLAS